MKRYNFLFALILSLSWSACGPDDINGSCNFNEYQKYNFTGYVNLCNLNPHQGSTFLAEALVFAIDSSLIINIESIEPNQAFNYKDTFKIECTIVEDFYIHNIIDPVKNEIIGEIGFEANNIGFFIDYPICSENSRFEGTPK